MVRLPFYFLLITFCLELVENLSFGLKKRLFSLDFVKFISNNYGYYEEILHHQHKKNIFFISKNKSPTSSYKNQKKNPTRKSDSFCMVRVEGLEPPSREALDPKSSVSTNFTTPAFLITEIYEGFQLKLYLNIKIM